MESTSRKRRRETGDTGSEDESQGEYENESQQEYDDDDDDDKSDDDQQGYESSSLQEDDDEILKDQVQPRKRKPAAEVFEYLRLSTKALEMRAILPLTSTHDYLTAPPSPPKSLSAFATMTDPGSDRGNATRASNMQAIDGSESQDEKDPYDWYDRTIKMYQEIDEVILKSLIKDVILPVTSGYEANRWKDLIFKHKEALLMTTLKRGARKTIDRLVLQGTYLNTVAPTHRDVQSIPMAQYREGTSGVEGLNQEEKEELAARAIKAGASFGEVRYSKQCTSCVIQGFDCSGHKPICSQCYYSSSRTTHSLSRNASPTNGPIPSSCSYPVDGKPLVPAYVFRSLMEQAEEESKADEDKRLPLTKVQKAIQKMAVSKDENEDVGWKINFKGRPIMDKNPASGVDYLIKSSSARSALGDSKKFTDVTIRDVALKIEDPEPLKKEWEEKDDVGENAVGSVGPLTVKKTKKGHRRHKRAKWIERALFQEDEHALLQKDEGALHREDEQVKDDSVNVVHEPPKLNRRVDRPIRLLSGKESMIRLEGEHGINDEGRKEETFISFSRNSRETLIDERNRRHFVDSESLLKGVKSKVKVAETTSGVWTVADRDGAGAATELADTAAAAATKTGEATTAVPPVKDPKYDVVELDVGGAKIKRRVRVTKVKRDPTGKKKMKIMAYRKRMAKTFRPWIAHKSEKVIPSACDIPETSFLQAIHFYASYYYTHACPCPDVFEAMDLTSHIALGMIIQEVISDFAFKLGKESQLEDIEVKQERLEYEKNLSEWKKIIESGGKIPKRDEARETMTEIKEQISVEKAYRTRYEDEYKRDKKLSLVGRTTTIRGWIYRKIEEQRKEENEYIERSRKHYNATGILGADEDDGDASMDEDDRTDSEIQKCQDKKSIDVNNNYWEELRYLKQYRFKPDTTLSERFLVNGYDSGREQSYDSGVESGGQRGQSRSSQDEVDSDTDMGDGTRPKKSEQGSQLRARPSFAFESDDEEYVSEDGSIIQDSDNDDATSKTTRSRYSMDTSDESSGDERGGNDDETESEVEHDIAPKTKSVRHSVDTSDDDGEVESKAGDGTNVKSRETSVAEETDNDSSNGVEEAEDDSDVQMEEPPQTIAPPPRSHATASTSARTNYDKLNEIVSDSEKGSNSEEESEDERYDMPSSVLTTLSDTRFGKMFGRGHDNDDDEDEDDNDDDDEVTNNGVISQVVVDDSSSEDEGNVVGPSESEEEE
ncbi:hypothetical protein BGX21_007163 [Mortierella sp. AD011]|nr:hypothetical protein BGX20_005277 [Mortierella sp. AD010]KAF9398867.1 hypothetical protein BGX21_007163 [Mortierella sp. AD011]